MLQRQEGEVNRLHKGPDHPVGLERGPPGRLELLLGAVALHGGHAAEEDTDHDRREGELVSGDAGNCRKALVGRVDAAGQKVEPCCGSRTKDD